MSELEQTLGQGLARTLTDKGALDVAADLGDAVLGAQFSDGILQNIPYLGSLIKLFEVGKGLRDRVLIKKILKFLGPLSRIPIEERQEFAKRLEKDAKYRDSIGEQLMIVLERLDDMNKPELIAWLFTQLVKDKISDLKFREMCMVVDRCFLGDLRSLDSKGPHGSTDYEPSIALRLLGCGLVEIIGIPVIKGPGAVNRYRLTSFGDEFKNLYDEYSPKARHGK